MKKNALKFFAFLAPAFFRIAALPAQDLTLPKDLIAAARPISTEEEAAIGRDVAANVLAQFGLYENEPLTEYVNLVGLTVAQDTPRRDVTYRFAVLDSPIVNAFAVPGGYIFVTKGLLSLLKDEAQLAGVLGHEIVHVVKRHAIAEIQKSRVVNAAIPSYVKASAKQAAWMSQVTDLAVQILWRGYSREDELEADRIGLEYAAAAGYDPAAYAEVLGLLRTKSEKDSQIAELKFLMSTHPKPEERIRQVEEKLKNLSGGGQKAGERFQKNVSAL